MKNELLLERLGELLPMLTEHAIAYKLTEKLIDEVKSDLRSEIAANNRRGNAHNVITKLLKENKDFRPGLAYAWIDRDNRQCVCDGYRAFRMKNHLPLEDRPESVGKPIDMYAIMVDDAEHNADYLPIELPSYAEVKAYIAMHKSEATKYSDILYHFGAGLPSVNAKYLADMMIVMPGITKLYWKDRISPLYGYCEEGDATILPVRVGAVGDQLKANHAAAKLYDHMRKCKAEALNDRDNAISIESLGELIKLADQAAAVAC